VIRRRAQIGRVGRLAFIAQVGERAAVGAEGIERLGALLPIAVIEVRHSHRAIAHAIERADRHRPIRIGDGQAAYQHRVHESEHRGVDANAQRKGDRGDTGEPFVLQEQACGKSDIFPKAHGIPLYAVVWC
jgi:hypothetical protein